MIRRGWRPRQPVGFCKFNRDVKDAVPYQKHDKEIFIYESHRNRPSY